MPRWVICSRDLHWHWINRTLLCDTVEVSMLHRAWLTIAQHVFLPALTGRLELISRKIVSSEPGTKAIVVSRFRKKLSPVNWVQGVTKYRALGRQKMVSNMQMRYIQFRNIHDHDISRVHCISPLWENLPVANGFPSQLWCFLLVLVGSCSTNSQVSDDLRYHGMSL